MTAGSRWDTRNRTEQSGCSRRQAPRPLWRGSPDGRFVGFAQLYSDGELQAFSAGVAVDEAWRGRDVGRALVEDALRRGGGDRIDLLSEDAATRFYESFPNLGKPGLRLYPFDRR